MPPDMRLFNAMGNAPTLPITSPALADTGSTRLKSRTDVCRGQE